MVRLASSPVGGYLSNGMARVGVRTSCDPGGITKRFSSVIQRNRLLRWRLSEEDEDAVILDGATIMTKIKRRR